MASAPVAVAARAGLQPPGASGASGASGRLAANANSRPRAAWALLAEKQEKRSLVPYTPWNGRESHLPCTPRCSDEMSSHVGTLRSFRRIFLAFAAATERLPGQLCSRMLSEHQWNGDEGNQMDRPSSTTGGKDPTQGSWNRRIVLATLSLGTAVPSSALAATSQETGFGTQFLRSIGIGDPDIYYPDFFEGTWDCFSTLVAVETPQGAEMADVRSVDSARKTLGLTVQYKARFVPYKDHIIGDRLFTTRSLVESTVGRDIITTGEWDPGRPNRLSLTLKGGLKVENLVTKRSSSSSGLGQFDTSEYSKQVFDNAREVNGPPSVKASRNATRYRWEGGAARVDQIEAFQRISMFPLVGGAAGNQARELSLMDVVSLNMGDKPTTVYKYIVRFTRDTGAS